MVSTLLEIMGAERAEEHWQHHSRWVTHADLDLHVPRIPDQVILGRPVVEALSAY